MALGRFGTRAVLALVLLVGAAVLPAGISPAGATVSQLSAAAHAATAGVDDVDQAVVDRLTQLHAIRGAGTDATLSGGTPLVEGPSAPTDPLTRSPVIPGSYLVTTNGVYDRRAYTAAGFDDATWIGSGVVHVTVDPAMADQAVAGLRGQPGVVSVEPNRQRQFHAVPNDPGYVDQWSHQITQIERAWDETTGNADVLVAVADSGIVASHPDLAGVVTEQVDAGTGQIMQGATDNDICRVGHGTWVAGVLAGVGDNATGIAGVNWDLSILDINTADPSLGCSGPSDVGTIAAIDYATRQGADVVNLSLGGPETECPRALQQAITSAIEQGTIVVASSGNGGPSGAANTPGSCNGVISVGSVTPTSSISGFSTTNPYVDLVGPGGTGGQPSSAADVLTTSFYANGAQTGEYVAVAGTSFSAPYVSGVAALIRAVNPALTPTQVESLLESTATDLGPTGRDDQYGWGLVNADAVVAAASGDPVGEPEPDPNFPTPSPGDDDDPIRPGGNVNVIRIASGPTTEPIPQAVQVSESVFASVGESPGPATGVRAQWGVIAREDDYADALAGSTLTLGQAPLLFTTQTGPLAEETSGELRRVLEPGSTVYLLGGVNALPAGLEAEVTALGFDPVRLAGPIRESTAAAVADEVDELLVKDGLEPASTVVIATRQNWPDAVGGGPLGSQFGMPILLTPTDSLARETAEALAARDLERVYVIGGNAAISDATEALIAEQIDTATITRLGGLERAETLLEVSGEIERLFGLTALERPRNALAVNLRRDDGFAHVLSATVPAAAFTGFFIPIEGDGGTILTQQTQDFILGLGLDTFLMGGPDLIADETGQQILQLIRETPDST